MKNKRVDKIKTIINVYEDFRIECLEYFKQENIRQNLIDEFNRIVDKSISNVRLAISNKTLDCIYNDFCNYVHCLSIKGDKGGWSTMFIMLDDIVVDDYDCDAVKDSISILCETIFCSTDRKVLIKKEDVEFDKVNKFLAQYKNRHEQQARKNKNKNF